MVALEANFKLGPEWFYRKGIMQLLTYDVIIVLQLIIIEGLLSFDNALALAAMVKTKLTDPQDQKRALVWGIWGSYIFRTAMVLVGVWIIQVQWVKLVAGLYLVWMATSELFLHHAKTIIRTPKVTVFLSKYISPLWLTIISVELMDVMFSIDSIGVALALSKKIWVLVTGAMLGILMMRLAAQMFIKLINKFPVLVKTAFILVGMAGINMVLDVSYIDCPIPEKMFLFLMFAITLGSIALNWIFPEYFAKHKIQEQQPKTTNNIAG